jgi:hypothetical protein
MTSIMYADEAERSPDQNTPWRRTRPSISR